MYAKLFINEWREDFPDTHFFGVGDRALSQDFKMECIGYAEDLAVVGLQEVISHWSEIKKCYYEILERAEALKPRFALLIDYPGFNLRLAKDLKAKGIPVVYYVSPQLWAWKKGRVKKVKKFVDDMMVVFPFEVDFYKNYNIEAHFVGHPLIEVIENELKDSNLIDKKTDCWGPQALRKPILGIMPGSRKSEIQFNLSTQLKTAQKLMAQDLVEARLLLAPTLNLEDIKLRAGEDLSGIEIVQKKPTLMIGECDLILSASGTATLQVALCEKPMVVMYRMNPITAFFARLLVTTVEFFCIVNLIAQEKVVPELFQNQAQSEKLESELLKILRDKTYRETMLSKLLKIKDKLGAGKATANLVQYLKRSYRS